MASLNDLVEALKAVENDPEVACQEYLTDYAPEDGTVSEVVMLADELLIVSSGRRAGDCEWNNIHTLKQLGYNVFAGEKDSFGWLTGCIRTSKGIIVYG